MLLQVKACLKEHLLPTQSIALALSGGADSRALLEILLPLRGKLYQNLHLIHIDHQWRPESTQEAEILKELAKEHNLPFHLKTLSAPESFNNLEAKARIARMLFFEQVAKEQGLEAIFLGHHADDQAETVLKRLFEGGGISTWAGFSECSYRENLKLLRPFIRVRKRELIDFLEKKEIPFFTDPTNQDPKWMRGKMRSVLLPSLSASFGKEITPSLLHISAEVEEGADYIQQCLAPILEQVKQGVFGALLDLSSIQLHSFLLRQLIRSLAKSSRTELQSVIDAVLENRAHFFSGKFYVDRRRLFVLNQQDFPKFAKKEKVALGESTWGQWRVQVTEEMGPAAQVCAGNHWLEAWGGKTTFYLLPGEYHLTSHENGLPYGGKRELGRFWTDAKVPALLRPTLPTIVSDERVVYELLSGRKTLMSRNREKETLLWKVDLSILEKIS